MMLSKHALHFLLLSLVLLTGGCKDADIQDDAEVASAVIAFGSCLRQWQPQPVWHSIAALSPEAFVLLGDNVYSDVGEYSKLPQPQRIGTAYADLLASEEFRAFRQQANNSGIRLVGTWDDHDYGLNDGGADFPHKLAAKQFFLDFFNLNATASGDASQAGVYQSYRLRLAGVDTQVILLDTRSFRSPLAKSGDSPCSKTKNVPNDDPAATVLGSRQWQWLEQQLRESAELRIIASSIQVIAEDHCFEKWANFPQQRQQLFDLIERTQAAGVVLISGDRHMAEISAVDPSPHGYRLYEITSSGLNSAMGLGGRLLLDNDNSLRVGEALYSDNFGSITVSRGAAGVELSLQIRTADGDIADQHSISLSDLRFPE